MAGRALPGRQRALDCVNLQVGFFKELVDLLQPDGRGFRQSNRYFVQFVSPTLK